MQQTAIEMIKTANFQLMLLLKMCIRDRFQIGFIIYIPFLVIDLVVSSTLMSMGMFMLPPAMISLPFKLLLFVMVDGWNLLIKSLIESFTG